MAFSQNRTDGDNADEERPSYSVREADENKQGRRIDEILDARKMVLSVEQTLFEQQARNEISQRGRNIGLQVAVKSFIRECLNLLPADGDTDVPNQVPHPYREKLGEVPMYWHSNIEVVGLLEYLETNETYQESFRDSQSAKHGPDKLTMRRQSHTVPKELSWQAYTVLWRYLNWEYDIDVQFEADDTDEEGGVM